MMHAQNQATSLTKLRFHVTTTPRHCRSKPVQAATALRDYLCYLAPKLQGIRIRQTPFVRNTGGFSYPQ